MMDDARTKEEAALGLLSPALTAPMSPEEQMKEKYGTGGTLLRMLGVGLSGGLLGHTLLPEMGKGARTKYAADLLQYQEDKKTADLLGAQDAFHTAFTDGDMSNDAQAYMTAIARGVDPKALQIAYGNDPMFTAANAAEDTDIMRTTKAYVDSYNEANKDKEGFEPMTFHQGYDIVKNYDAGRRGAQAGAVANAGNSSDSDFATFNTAKNDYISAFENADVLNGSLANVDRGIEMLQNGEVDTGLFNGFLFNVFGIGTSAMGELNSLSKNATIDKLMTFKGPTTDFEFSQSEAAAFASIMKGEDVNEGTMKTARAAIERAIKRNATLAESAYGTMTDMGKKLNKSGTVDIVGRNYKPWWQQEEQAAGANAGDGSGGGAESNAQAMPEAQALEWLRNNNTPENRAFFAETYGKEPTL